MGMKQKSIKKNYIYNTAYQVLVLITPLVTTPYLSRILGADGVGTVSFAESVVAYFTLFATLGITTFGQREISYVQDDREKRTRIFWETKSLQAITSLSALVLYIIFSLLQEQRVLYLILSLNVLTVLFDVVWLIQGMEEFGKIVFRNVLFKLLNIIYIFVVVKTKDDILKYVFGLAFFVFLSNISLWVHIPQYVGKPNFKEIQPFRNIKVVLALFIPTIAVQIYTVFDRTMIGLITKDAFENGYYEQAIKISKMVMTVVTSLGTVMIPRIGYHYGRGEIEIVKNYMYRGYRFVWFLGTPLCLGLIGTSASFVPWFFGPGYEKVVPLLSILSFLIIAIGINNVTGLQYFVPTKRENLLTVTVVTGACVNFVLNLLLIPHFKSMGAAVASIVAEVTVALVQLYLVKSELSFWKIVKFSRNYVAAGAVMYGVLILLGQRMSPNILHTMIMVVAGAVVYFLVLCLLKDSFLMNMRDEFVRKYYHNLFLKAKGEDMITTEDRMVDTTNENGLIKISESLRSKVKKLTEILYYASVAIYFTFSILFSSMFSAPLTAKRYVIIMAGMIGLMLLREMMLCLFVKKYDIREVIGLGLCFFLWYFAEKNDSSIMMCVYLLVFGSRNVELNKTYKLAILLTIAVSGIVLWAAGEGYILNYNFTEKGQYRHCFGFCYPLILPCYILNVAMMIAVMRKDKVSWTEIAMMILFGVMFYRWCKAELSGAMTIVVAVFLALVKIWPKLLTSDFILWRILDGVAVVIYPLCIAISLWFTFKYDASATWMSQLDEILRGRLRLQQSAYLNKGFSFLGQKIYFVGAGLYADGEIAQGTYDYVDNTYISILLRYGIIFSVIALILVMVTMYYCYQKKMRIWLWMLSLWALHGLFEDKLHIAYFNSLILIMGQAIQNVDLSWFRGHKKH